MSDYQVPRPGGRYATSQALLNILGAPIGTVNVSYSSKAGQKGAMVVEVARGVRLAHQPTSFEGYEVIYRVRKIAHPLRIQSY